MAHALHDPQIVRHLWAQAVQNPNRAFDQFRGVLEGMQGVLSEFIDIQVPMAQVGQAQILLAHPAAGHQLGFDNLLDGIVECVAVFAGVVKPTQGLKLEVGKRIKARIFGDLRPQFEQVAEEVVEAVAFGNPCAGDFAPNFLPSAAIPHFEQCGSLLKGEFLSVFFNEKAAGDFVEFAAAFPDFCAERDVGLAEELDAFDHAAREHEVFLRIELMKRWRIVEFLQQFIRLNRQLRQNLGTELIVKLADGFARRVASHVNKPPRLVLIDDKTEFGGHFQPSLHIGHGVERHFGQLLEIGCEVLPIGDFEIDRNKAAGFLLRGLNSDCHCACNNRAKVLKLSQIHNQRQPACQFP